MSLYDNMISSNGNQYLRPEYLSPLPTTLDAKKSPLALLAQTCSQIGADSPNTKSLLAPLERSSKKTETSREKSSPSSVSSCSPVNVKSSFKPYDSTIKDMSTPEDKSGTRVKTPSKSTTPAQNGTRCGSNQSASSPRGSPGSRKTPASQELPATSKSETSSHKSSSPQDRGDSGAFKSSSLPPITSSAFLPGYPGSLPLDVMASSFLNHPLKTGLNPYLSYARMKTASGADTLVPVCRDPYCTGCQLSSHLLSPGKGPCPAGCVQCEKTPPGFLPSPGHHSAVAAAYAHAQLAALAAASQLPYVCSWIGGDATYCGKRFSSSEELLQHLRTHTSDSLLSPSPSSHHLLNRTYPTPPLSPLATARYHPYNKPPLLPPSLSSAFPLPPHPGIPPYFSPYSLYGARLGASSGMHP